MVAEEPVDHPPHYKSGGLEAIDVIEAFELNFHLGNTMKYILRAGKKAGEDDSINDRRRKAINDLEKSAWYLAREIERRKKELRLAGAEPRT